MRVPGELRIQFEDGEQIFLLEAPTTTIGREARNALPLLDPGVSRFHAELIRLGKDYLLRDLGSANGSFVNGVRVSEQLLNDGDVLRFGASGPQAVFRLVSSGETTGAHERHSQSTTDSLITSLSTMFDPAFADTTEELNRCCILAEAYLSRGQHEKALDVLAKYAEPEVARELPAASHAKILYWRGRAHTDAKQYAAARDILNEALTLYTQLGDDAGIAATRAASGRAFTGLGDWATARDHLHRAALTARKSGNARLHAEAHLLLGRLDWKEGDFEGARYNWSRAARLAEDGNDAVLQAGVQLQQAFILLSEGKLQEAVPAYQLAIEQIEKIGNVRFLLKAYSNLSRTLTRLGSWAATERLLEYRLRLARDHQLAKAEAVALTDLAELRYLQGNLAAAWNVIQASMQRHGSTVYARTQRIVGRILAARQDYRGAINEYKRGLEAAKRKGALEEQILIGIELALAWLELGDKEKASAQLDAVESDPMLDPGLGLMARALHARALIHAAFGETAEANRALSQSLSLFTSIGDTYRTALCHAAIGALRAEAGRLESARAHLEEAKASFAKLGARADLERIERQLSVVATDSIIPLMTQILPASLSRAAPLSLAFSPTAKLNTAEIEFKPQHILIAQADEGLASILENGLVAENFVVDRVMNGQLALERAVSPAHTYDLLVLDTLLEHRSGFDVCRDLRKANLDVPLILLGNRQGSEDKIEALQAGADDFLGKKNLVFEELLAKVNSLLS